VFWNFAWTIADNARFKELREMPDWKFVGFEHFQMMQSGGGAILLTAHMGNSDLGAHIFSEVSGRDVVMVRAPEADPQTRAFEAGKPTGALRVAFNTEPENLALTLLEHVRAGEIVAIQGDRVTEGIASVTTTLFGRKMLIPAGPFALAMAAQVPIYPMFIIRDGYRSYRLISCAPIAVVRTRDRDATLAAATEAWTRQLESVVGRFWFQWFEFRPFAQDGSP
jgi:lauroyl/myristoyl acyltransferase